MADVPQVDREDLLAFVRERFPDARVESKTVNLAFGSWDIEVITDVTRLHICWGPLSGFGGTDVNNISDEGDPFAPFDVWFKDADHAKTWLVENVT